MNELKFNSQICTSIEQSRRLLILGLKTETADCFHWECAGVRYIGNIDDEGLTEKDVPAWSLHRLIELLPQDIHLDDYADTHYYLAINPFKVIYVNCHLSWIYQRDEGCLYDKLIDTIEWTIKNNFFNKEYLTQ